MTIDSADLLARFLRYVQIDTRSDAHSATTPTTPGQWDLLRLLTAELTALGRDLAMQIAAADPKYVRRDQVDSAHLAKEAEIARDRARNEGKPEKILDKIVEGRLSKFYEEVCLLEQPFIKDNALTVTELIKQKGKDAGATIDVQSFVRFKVGETQSSEEAPAE